MFPPVPRSIPSIQRQRTATRHSERSLRSEESLCEVDPRGIPRCARNDGPLQALALQSKSLIRHDDSVIHLTTLAGHDRPANSLLCRLAMSARRHFGVRRPCRRFCDWRSRARLVCGSPAPAGRARFTNRHGERWALALQTGRRIPHFGRHVCLFWSARRPKLTSLRRPVRKSLRWS